MKMCHSEIMKRIKLLEQEKSRIILEEHRICQTSYIGKDDKIDSGYSFDSTRNKITNINNEVRHLKHALNHSNATTVVDGFDMTLGECLVYMAQLNNEKSILESLASKEQSTRRSTANGVIEYTDLNYDRVECRKELRRVQEIIAKLQISIDRTNLTNMIEV